MIASVEMLFLPFEVITCQLFTAVYYWDFLTVVGAAISAQLLLACLMLLQD
jgi:hypothetical protein